MRDNRQISSTWGELFSIIQISLKKKLCQPDVFNTLALLLLEDETLDPPLSIVLRNFLIDDGEDEAIDVPCTIREFNRCFSKIKSNDDANYMGALLVGIKNVENAVIENEGDLAALPLKDAEIFVYNSLNIFKIFDDLFIGKRIAIDNFGALIIRSFCDLIDKCLEIHPELVNTYLLYQFIRTITPFAETKDCLNIQEDLAKLFERFYESPYLSVYMGAHVSSEALDELTPFLPEGLYEEVKDHMKKFQSLSEKDNENLFQDSITSAFIIQPYTLPGGNNNIWVDEWMITCQLREKPSNPYTREPLTIENLKEYNCGKRDEIKDYEKKRKEFISC